MGMIDSVGAWARGIDAGAVVEAIVRRAEEAGPPPVVGGLGARDRQSFDRVVDALNRLPRPIMTFGTLALMAAAVAAPDWFEGRMRMLAQIPDAVWWALGAVLGIHFGARVQDKAQEARREAGPTIPPERAGTPAVATPRGDATLTLGALLTGPNPALDDWRSTRA